MYFTLHLLLFFPFNFRKCTWVKSFKYSIAHVWTYIINVCLAQGFQHRKGFELLN